MDSEMLTDQRELVERLESADWTVTAVELDALVEEPVSDDDDDRNPFRVN